MGGPNFTWTSDPCSIPTFVPPRRKIHTSYDARAPRTVGALFAPNQREAAWRLDFLHLILCARTLNLSDLDLSRLVTEYTLHRPTRWPEWDRLSQQEKYFLYTAAAEELSVQTWHMLTLRLPFEYEMVSRAKGFGPVRQVGTFLNRHVSDVFRRGGEPLRYILKIELTRDFHDEAGWSRKRTTFFTEFHATVLLAVPGQLRRKVQRRLAYVTGTPLEALYRQNSGYNAHLQRIKPERAFESGTDATGRSGLAGAADYAGKDFRVLTALQEFYRKHDAPARFDKTCGASADIQKAARALYTDLIFIVRERSLSASPRPVHSADEFRRACASALRIAGSHPSLAFITNFIQGKK